MSIRIFFLLSLLLAVLAVGVHLTAMSQASSYSKRGAVLDYIGLAIAFASVAFVVASARRHEPARRIVVFVVLICNVMLRFGLI